MKLFVKYLRSRLGVAALLALCLCTVFIVLALFHIRFFAVVYAAALCLFFTLLFAVFDFIKFYRKHKLLSAMLNEPDIFIEHLPSASNAIEADYALLVSRLAQDKRILAAETERRYSDLVDYYTVWAHQIKTPIAAMRLVLQSGDETDGGEIASQLQRIEQYVDMVLCYLRLDSDSTDYVIKEYDLDSIVCQAVRRFAPQFIRKKIKLFYEPLSRKVLSDEKWLLFVIEQVISNSLKYTREGSVTIDMEEPDILCIRDTGIGIAPEDLPRIFEKGFTGYNGRDDKKASGIGLYLCRRICENLGHRIVASSAAGSGTVIRIYLHKKQMQVE